VFYASSVFLTILRNAYEFYFLWGKKWMFKFRWLLIVSSQYSIFLLTKVLTAHDLMWTFTSSLLNTFRPETNAIKSSAWQRLLCCRTLCLKGLKKWIWAVQRV
jgi:hypothetical protein